MAGRTCYGRLAPTNGLYDPPACMAGAVVTSVRGLDACTTVPFPMYIATWLIGLP